MADGVALTLGGIRYRGWTTVRITRSIEAAAASFQLQLTDRWPGQGNRVPVKPSDACTVDAGGDQLVNGYVDNVRRQIEDGGHTISVRGRDRTADLVDSSADGPGEYRGLTLLQVARKIAEPHGISVRADAPVGDPFDTFKVQPGETGFDALESAARQRGLLLMSDTDGSLVFSRPGNERTGSALIEGRNILAGSSTLSHQDRYYRYIVRGQQPGSDNVQRTSVTEPEGKARDAALSNRSRLLLVVAEKAATPASAKQRAQWEAATRAARSVEVRITVQGWRQAGSDGLLWMPNFIVPVRAPTLDIDGDMLISGVTYKLDDNGTTADLHLTRADAFQPKPVVDDTEDDGNPGMVAGGSGFDPDWGT